MLPKELLEILCCPVCRGDLLYEAPKDTLTCRACGKVYRIKDDIPIMLPDDEPDAAGPSHV
jgi:hypothetical protein